MTTKRPWNGGVGVGSPTFTATEQTKVVTAMLRHVGQGQATSEEALRDETGVPARTLRAILSARDGLDFVLYNPSNKRLFVCEYAEQAEHTTRQLRSRARSMNTRADRRDIATDGLPRNQGSFDFYGQEDDEPEVDL